jgi:hypothetical protein
MSANATTLSGLTTPNDEDLYVQAADAGFGDGPWFRYGAVTA